MIGEGGSVALALDEQMRRYEDLSRRAAELRRYL
jgi:hypothetical protein